jgi:hypothetical protein
MHPDLITARVRPEPLAGLGTSLTNRRVGGTRPAGVVPCTPQHRRCSLVVLGWSAWCLLFVPSLLAVTVTEATPAPSPDEMDVVAVRFERPRGPEGIWFVCEVEVMLRPGPENRTRFINRPGVALELGLESPAQAPHRFEFYRAEATAVAVEQGRAVFRFYLPPEVVARDRLTSDARFFYVELTLAGRSLPAKRSHVSGSLPHPEALEKFRARVAAEGAVNRGVLRSQAWTPFAAAAGGPAAPTLLSPP